MSSGTPRRNIQVRAIPSAFATKSTPAIPPASETYEPLAKAVLRHRLTHYVTIRTAACCWIFASIWSGWTRRHALGLGGLLLNALVPSTLLYASSFWVMACLPALLLRKKYLTASPTIANSPLKTLYLAISKPTTIRTAITYCSSALSIAVLHAFASPDARLSVFVQSKKHPYYLNGRLLFLLCFQAFAAMAFTLRNVMLDRFAFRPTDSPSSSFSSKNLLRIIVTAMLLSTISLPASMVAFAIARIVILPVLFRIPFVPMLLKAFTAHFLRSPRHMLVPFRYFSLLSRAWSLGVSTSALWELSNALFDYYIPQQIAVGVSAADPAVNLISGALSSDKVMKHFAYAELRGLAVGETPAASAWRTGLFGDQKYMPSLWSTLAKNSLTTLGHDYQLFLRRGGPAPPPPAAAPAPPPPQPSFPSTPKKLIEKPIYKTSTQSPIRNVIDSFAADGSFAQALDEAEVPDIFRSVTNAVVEPANAAAKEEVRKVREAGKGLLGLVTARTLCGTHDAVMKYAPVWIKELIEAWKDWWTKERLAKVAEGCLPNRELDVLVIEVLTNLVCASLTEDRYGVVQRDIPKILEAMLSFLSEVETYQKEVNAMYTPPPTDVRLSVKELDASEFVRGQVESAGEILSTVSDALKDGVARIVRTFGDKLLAFKFPPRTASKLQAFMDYC